MPTSEHPTRRSLPLSLTAVAGSQQERLLLVQAHDVAVDQLRYRSAHLPDRTSLEEIATAAGAVRRRRDEVEAARAETGARQARAETELSATEARRRDVDRRMTSGAVTASRDLQRMADEVDHLGRRASDLEDEVLEAMTEGEPLDRELDWLSTQLADLEQQARDLTSAIAAAEVDIDAQISGEQDTRRERAAGLDGVLLKEYERLRARLGGVGAARLVNGQCTGCYLTLPSAEDQAARLAPADAILHCEQCGRILVH